LAYRVAHFALRPKKIRRHEAALARRREENAVVVDQGVVEIDADP